MNARAVMHALAALVLALGATPADARGAGAAGLRSPASSAAPAQDRPQRASRIIGMDVINPRGEKVGDIEDIVLDRHGNAAYAIVSTGGFLGVGEKLHAVPWRALQPDPNSESFTLDVDKERLARAPGFDANNFPDLGDPKWSAENRRHFPAGSGGATTGRDTTPAQPTRADRTRDRATGSGAGRPAGNDIGPSGTTSGRSGNAAGAGSATADGSQSTTGTGAGATPAGGAGSPARPDSAGSGSAAGIGPAAPPGTTGGAVSPTPGPGPTGTTR